MPKSSPYPENWPTSIPYLSTPVISPGLSKTVLSTQALTSPSLEPDAATISNPQTPYTNIRITPINDTSHPAYPQHGLYTTRIHPPGSFICLYLGLVHATSTNTATGLDPATTLDIPNPNSSHPEPKSDYDLSLDRDLSLAIDAMDMGNEARFINDYRGVAVRPNAEFRDVIIKLKGEKGKKERGVGVFVKAAKKDKKGKVKKEDEVGIRKGEEVLVSYGRGFWSARRVEAEARGEADSVVGLDFG